MRKGKLQTPRRVTLNASTATKVSSSNSNWISRIFRNTDASITMYWGDSNVTTSNGQELKAGEVLTEDIISSEIYMIAASGTPVVSVIEVGGD